MKICLIGDNPESFTIGSATFKVQNNLDIWLNKSGIQTDLYIYTKSNNLLSKLFEKLHFIKDDSGITISGGVVRFIIYLLKNNYDIIHFILSRYFSIPILLAAQFLKAKTISTFHDNYIFPRIPEINYHNLKLYLLKRIQIIFSDLIFVYNISDKKRLSEKYQSKRIAIVKNGIEPDNFYNAKNDSIRKVDILYGGGKLRAYKGYKYFIEIVQQIPKEYIIEICGEGTSLNDKFEIGHLTENEFFEKLRNSKIVIVPSKYEAFGLLGIEAMACGAVLIITENCGLAQYLEHDNGCVIVPNNNSKLVASKIYEILSNDALRRKMSEQAIDYAENFDWSYVIDEYTKIYSNIAMKKNG